MKLCRKCKKEHDGTFGSGKYCCRQCANSRKWTRKDKEIKRKAALKRLEKGKWGFMIKVNNLKNDFLAKTLNDHVLDYLETKIPPQIEMGKIRIKFTRDGRQIGT